LSGYTRVGIALLLLASACLIGASAYAHHAFGNPEGITYYPNVMFVVRPAVGPAPVVAFVAVEHLLVGSGIWCLRRGMLRRAAPPAA
jgi:hypothetical protein